MELRTVRGTHFLRVNGNSVERCRQHAELLKHVIPNGALPVLSKKNEWLIRRAPGITQFKPLQDFVVWTYRNIAVRWFGWQIGSEMRTILKVMAHVTGVPYKTCIESVLQAEGLMMLSRISVMKNLHRQLPSAAFPGCTSAVVTGDWTASGRLMMARNMDYPIVGPWEGNTTVVFHEPEERDHIPHVAVTTAGVHTSGLTAMNREGLILSTHAHFARGVSAFGKPIVVVGNEVISKARTLGEAIDIARKNRRIMNWAFVIASAKEKDAVVVEMSPHETFIYPMHDGFISHTNYFRNEHLRKNEALISGGCFEDLVGRACRIQEILQEDRGRLTPSHLAGALSDHFDSKTGVDRVFGNTVSVVTTVKSTVFDPEIQKLYVSSATESPAAYGDFQEIDVDRFWSAPTTDLPVLSVQRKRLSERIREAMKHYRDAYVAWHVENDHPEYEERTRVGFERAVEIYPEDGHLWLGAGLITFRIQRFDRAEVLFRGALERKLSLHVRQVARLFLARCLDVSGRRSEALEIYREMDRIQDSRLRSAYRSGVRRAYRPGRSKDLLLDLQFADAHQY